MTQLRRDILLLVAFFGLASRVSLQERIEFSGLFVAGLAASAVIILYMGIRLLQQKNHFTTWLLVLTIALVVAISTRNGNVLKNALIFWPVFLPLLLTRCPWSLTLRSSLELLWGITLALVLIDVLTLALQEGIMYGLFGPAYRLVFSERTWVSLFFALYVLYYLAHYRRNDMHGNRLLIKAAVSMMIAVITQSFATILALAVTVPFVLTRSLVGRGLIMLIILTVVPLIGGAFGELVDNKLQARAIALLDEVATTRTITELSFGFEGPRVGPDYEELPGVPDIGLNSFTLPYFLLNNFGWIGICCFFLLLIHTTRRARQVPIVLLATTVVSFLHPVHLQLEFMLLATLLTLTFYPQLDRTHSQ